MQENKRKFPIPSVVYSIASKGAGWFHYPLNSGENKRKLEEIRGKLNATNNND